MNEKQYICSASLGCYVHLTSNQLHSIKKEELPKPGVLKTSSLKMYRGQREIHAVHWGYMFNLVSNVNNMLDSLQRFGLQFSFKLYCDIL